MYNRQEKLTSILTAKFGSGYSYPHFITREDLISNRLLSEVTRIYKKLGGILDEAPLSFGKWDLCLNNFIVELDEEQHFNRYRAISLQSYIYFVTDGFEASVYEKHCIDHENHCLRKASRGKYWTSPSTERQFGLPGKNGNLEGNGSPRWRQRAYYDYLRDVFSVIHRIPLIRLSIYDQILIYRQNVAINEILLHGNDKYFYGIVNFIEQKANKPI